MESSTVTEPRPRFSVGQEVFRYQIYDTMLNSSGVPCYLETGSVVEFEDGQFVRTDGNCILPLRECWCGSMNDAAMEAAGKIWRIINTLHEQIGKILERSAGK